MNCYRNSSITQVSCKPSLRNDSGTSTVFSHAGHDNYCRPGGPTKTCNAENGDIYLIHSREWKDLHAISEGNITICSDNYFGFQNCITPLEKSQPS